MSDDTETNLPAKSEAFQKFDNLPRRLFAVPKAELDEGITEDNKQARRRQDVKTANYKQARR